MVIYCPSHRPFGWECRIRRLHLCRGVRPTNEATCWLWVMICKEVGWNPGGWAVIDPVTECLIIYNTPLRPLLDLKGSRIGSIRSIGRARDAQAHMFIFYLGYYSICSCEQCPALYLIDARRRRLKVNCGKRKGLFDPGRFSYKNQNLTEIRNLALNMSIVLLYPRLSQGEWASILVHSLLKFDSVMGGGS